MICSYWRERERVRESTGDLLRESTGDYLADLSVLIYLLYHQHETKQQQKPVIDLSPITAYRWLKPLLLALKCFGISNRELRCVIN